MNNTSNFAYSTQASCVCVCSLLVCTIMFAALLSTTVAAAALHIIRSHQHTVGTRSALLSLALYFLFVHFVRVRRYCRRVCVCMFVLEIVAQCLYWCVEHTCFPSKSFFYFKSFVDCWQQTHQHDKRERSDKHAHSCNDPSLFSGRVGIVQYNHTGSMFELLARRSELGLCSQLLVRRHVLVSLHAPHNPKW